MDVRFHMGSNMIMAGPTDSGKSSYVVNLIKNSHIFFDKPPERVYWHYGVHTKMHDELKEMGVTMRREISDDFEKLPPNSLIVIDDLMEEVKNSTAATRLFTGLAHHKPFQFRQRLALQSRVLPADGGILPHEEQSFDFAVGHFRKK